MTGLDWEDDGSQESLLTRRSAQICLSDKEIEDFVFDRLSGVTREVIEEHLLACGSCLSRVEREESYIESFRAAAAKLETDDLKKAFEATARAGPKVPNWGWALSAVLLVILGGIYVVNLPPKLGEVEVTLRVERGAGPSGFAAQAGQPLRLVPEMTGVRELPKYTLSVVDSSGRLERSSEVSSGAGRIQFVLPKGLPSGNHWVRISIPGPSAELLREYALLIR